MSQSSLQKIPESETWTLNKWQTALLIGTPIVLGAGALYWYYSRKPSRPERRKKSNIKNGKTTVPKVKEEVPASNDPLSQAMSFKSRGNKLFGEGKYEDCIRCYTDAINICPAGKSEDLAIFFQNRAAAHEKLKRYREVIADCTNSIGLNKKYVKALTRRAKAYEMVGQPANALQDITAACILERFENQTNLLLTDKLLREQSKIKAKAWVKTRPPQMPSSKHHIRHYFMSFCRDPVVKDPNVDEKDLYELLDSLRVDEGEGDAENALYLLLKGTIEILKGNLEEALLDLKPIPDMNCDKDVKVNALIKLGTIRVQDIAAENGLEAASNCFKQAIEIDRDNPDIYLHRAQMYIVGEEVEKAKQDLEMCCDLAPTFSSAVAQRLYVQFRCAMRISESVVETAIKEFEESLDKFSNSSEVYSLYAQALLEQGKFESAEKHFIEALEKDPNDANLYVHRGILHLQWSNNVDLAVSLLEKALQVDDKCQFAYEMLGSIEVQRGNLAKGISYFEKALESAQSEFDCAHLFSLRDAAEAQLNATKLLGIDLTR